MTAEHATKRMSQMRAEAMARSNTREGTRELEGGGGGGSGNHQRNLSTFICGGQGTRNVELAEDTRYGRWG